MGFVVWAYNGDLWNGSGDGNRGGSLFDGAGGGDDGAEVVGLVQVHKAQHSCSFHIHTYGSTSNPLLWKEELEFAFVQLHMDRLSSEKMEFSTLHAHVQSCVFFAFL